MFYVIVKSNLKYSKENIIIFNNNNCFMKIPPCLVPMSKDDPFVCGDEVHYRLPGLRSSLPVKNFPAFDLHLHCQIFIRIFL